MDTLTALQILESAVWRCKQEDIRTPEVLQALNFLEPHVQPKWLIPQYRNALDGSHENEAQKEALEQVLRATIGGIRKACVRLLNNRLDELARRYHTTHDEKIKSELEDLSHRVAKLRD
jgi:hypothetical protein